MRFYSQNGEDQYLSEHWEELGLPEIGVFVDVGAGNGVYISNTKMLEDRGWRGILIEPDARHWESLRINRAAFAVHAAIGAYQRDFYIDEMTPELSGFLRTAGKKLSVPVIQLNSVMTAHNIDEVDVLSVDTEGTELEVMNTLGCRPRIVIIEWDTLGIGQQRDDVKFAMNVNSYDFVVELGCNLIFKRRA